MIHTEPYLRTLLKEKGISEHYVFTIKKNHFWQTHLVEMEVVIHFITNKLDAKSQNLITDTLIRIDYNNGDILHYLEFITSSMIDFRSKF